MKWWKDDELPPPSMRQKYIPNWSQQLSHSSYSSRPLSLKTARRNIPSDLEPENSLDRDLKERLANLKTNKSGKEFATVEVLEERSKRLKGKPYFFIQKTVAVVGESDRKFLVSFLMVFLKKRPK